MVGSSAQARRECQASGQWSSLRAHCRGKYFLRCLQMCSLFVISRSRFGHIYDSVLGEGLSRLSMDFLSLRNQKDVEQH